MIMATKVTIILHLRMSLYLTNLVLDSIKLKKHSLDFYVIILSQIDNLILELINFSIFPLLSFNKYY